MQNLNVNLDIKEVSNITGRKSYLVSIIEGPFVDKSKARSNVLLLGNETYEKEKKELRNGEGTKVTLKSTAHDGVVKFVTNFSLAGFQLFFSAKSCLISQIQDR